MWTWAAAVWGLVRSAQSEHPGRFVLLDTDAPDTVAEVAAAVLACGEPQIAIRGGVLHAARLILLPPNPNSSPEPSTPWGEGWVLVTGGGGQAAVITPANVAGLKPAWTFRTGEMPPSDVHVSVENGTGRTNLAHTAATQLQGLGFQIGIVADATATAVTTISYGPSELAAAEAVQTHVPEATLLPTTSAGIVLILGANFNSISPTPTAPVAIASAVPPTLSCAP